MGEFFLHLHRHRHPRGGHHRARTPVSSCWACPGTCGSAAPSSARTRWPWSQSAELERRIAALITTGEEDASFTESYERLKKQLNRRKHNKTGQIPVLERDIAQLHQSLQELDALEQQARQAQEEVSALTQRVDGLRHQAVQQQAQIRQERINAWHRAARTAEEAQRRADILAEAAAPLPDNAALSLLEGQAAALQSDMAALTGQRSAANEARTAAAEAHAVWEAHPLYPDDAAALERRAASIAPAKAPSLLLPAADATAVGHQCRAGCGVPRRLTPALDLRRYGSAGRGAHRILRLPAPPCHPTGAGAGGS